MNILAEARDPDFSPGELALPFQPWQGDRERHGRGFSKPWPGSRSWGSFGSARFTPMSEYVYANGELLERLDFDPELGYGMTRRDVEYYAQDLLGSVMMTTGPDGRIRERYEYDSYGQAYEGSFRRINDLGYNGKRTDPTTGLLDYGFRDYAPRLGRFTTSDPIQAGNNWCAYVGGEPVNLTDPWGLSILTPEDEASLSVDEKAFAREYDEKAREKTAEAMGSERDGSVRDAENGGTSSNAGSAKPSPSIPAILSAGWAFTMQGFSTAWDIAEYAVNMPFVTMSAIDEFLINPATTWSFGMSSYDFGLATGVGGLSLLTETAAAKAAWNAVAAGSEVKAILEGASRQFGKKFGEHLNPSLPGYRTIDEYTDLATQILNDPTAQRTVFGVDSKLYAGETHILDSSGNLLRLDPSGMFRSLYPTR